MFHDRLLSRAAVRRLRQLARTVTPSGVERHFADDEIIVSKTDPKGIITYANATFMRMAALSEDQLIGAPHSLIRHPDMPRGVFKLLWDTLAEGREIFAYVLNLAADGAHYWVFAHVTPSYGADGKLVGYHSNRRTPDPEALAVITPIYAEMRAAEAAHVGRNEQAAAGVALLSAKLKAAGVGYDAFIFSL